jgi:proline-specific peptidase
MTSTTQISNRPPGQKRQYPAPDHSGHVQFTPPGTSLECQTHYTLWGTLSNNSLTPLICIHGGPGATSSYMKPFSLLHVDHGFPVILYDQLGCGQSTHFPDKKGDTDFWTIDLFVAELQNLITALKISGSSFDLLGHSWGGQLAARFAAQQPQRPTRLRKLVIAQSTAVIAHRTEYFNRQMENLPPPFGEAAKRATREGNTDTAEYKAALTEYSKHHMCRLDPWPQELLNSMAAFEKDDTVHSTLESVLQDFDLQSDLRKLTDETVPGGVLVMNGRFDQSVDEVVWPFFALPSARVKWVRFAESSHMAMLEETEEVMAATGRFLMME